MTEQQIIPVRSERRRMRRSETRWRRRLVWTVRASGHAEDARFHEAGLRKAVQAFDNLDALAQQRAQKRRAKPKGRKRPFESDADRRARLRKLAKAMRAIPRLMCSRFVGLPERDEDLATRRRKERNRRKLKLDRAQPRPAWRKRR